MTARILAGTMLAATLAWAGFGADPAAAGCGCQKPPPDLAQVRPNATYPGTEVSLFDRRFVAGQTYSVTFTAGTTTGSATLAAKAVSRRDLADGVVKPQLVVALPTLPLGPASIQVKSGTTTLFTLSDAAFTVVPLPVQVPEEVGGTSHSNFRAAIGRDGTFYISLDMTAVTMPRVYRAQARGYPLVFASDAVAFYNTQGFLMQLLNKDMPGLYSIISTATSTDSSVLGYSRHEFNTYYLQHEERADHAVIDGNWHADGTRHIDHDHLILAISGTLYNGTLPTPGATPPFTLRMERTSLFHHGMVAASTAADALKMSNDARTDSYDSASGLLGQQGDVHANGTLTMTNSALVDGNATAKAFSVAPTAQITGRRTYAPAPEVFLGVKLPDFLTNLGALTLQGSATKTLPPGSYLVQPSLVIRNDAVLYADNCAGPVTLYVSGNVLVQDKGKILTCSSDPEMFALYVDGDKPVVLQGSEGSLYGVVYAPKSLVEVKNNSDLYGAVVAGRLDVSNRAALHYDRSLRGRTQMSVYNGGGEKAFSAIPGGDALLTGGDGLLTGEGDGSDPAAADALYVEPEL